MSTILLSPPVAPIIDLSRYLEFEEDDVWLAGTKIGLWQIVQAYEAGAAPEQMVVNYQGVSLAQIYAAITYYLANRESLSAAVEPVNTHALLLQTLRERLNDRYHIYDDNGRVHLTAV